MKCYVRIFVSLVVKTVHMELVMDLTIQMFLAPLKRFVTRRDKPQLIMCDNAKTELHRSLHDQKFQDKSIKNINSDGIEFRFITLRTPNFGGLWKAQAKSFKGHFKKVVGTKVLRVGEMLTARVFSGSATTNCHPKARFAASSHQSPVEVGNCTASVAAGLQQVVYPVSL